jgi:phage terminase large subunit
VDVDTGEWNPMYRRYHIPIVENLKNLPKGYYDNVVEATKDDPIEYRRMVLGEWIDRPSGDAIFKNYFSSLNVRGNMKEGTRIIPTRNYDFIIGYDLGTANSAIVFMQNIPTKTKDLWVVFDEMVYTDSYIPYTQLVPEILRRVAFWNERVKADFRCQHISDSTAFNQFRAHTGTYDSMEVERLSIEAVSKTFQNLKPIKLIECPKFAGSVAGRVKTTMKLLEQERLIISDSCTKVKDMFMKLESEKMDEKKKYSPDLPFSPKRSKHLHPFDAMSYALFYYALGHKVVEDTPKGSFFFMGSQK